MTIHQIRQFALSLPETTEQPHFHLTSFRVKGKIFATAPLDGESLRVFVSEEERQIALTEHPDFLEKFRWGKRVVGLSVTVAGAKPAVVEKLLRQAWTHKAPKKTSCVASNAKVMEQANTVFKTPMQFGHHHAVETSAQEKAGRSQS